MTPSRIADIFANKIAVGERATVEGWIRTRRDSKAGLSFIQVHDGSAFASLQIVAPAALANYQHEILHLTAGCAIRATGTLAVWSEPYVHTRIPKLFNLRADPYERADITSNTYWDWYLDHAFIMLPASEIVGNFLATFKEFPPSQRAASFTIDKAMESLKAGISAR